MATIIGIGGGAINVPALIIAGVNPKIASPASLVAVFATSIGGLRYLFKRGLVNYRLGLILETASIAGVYTGILLYKRATPAELEALLSLVLYLSAVGFILKQRSPGEARDQHTRSPLRILVALGVSFAAGMFSAMLGIGGGVLKVPILVLVLGLPVHEAVSTSKFMILLTSATGLLGHAGEGHIDWVIAIPLALGAYAGATVSARVLVRLRARSLYLVAIAYYIAMGTYLLCSTLPH